jgi:hypothetical protein
VIVLGLQKFYQNPTESVIAELYESLNGISLTDIPTYSDNQKLIWRAKNDKAHQEYVVPIQYSAARINVKIPLTLFPDEVGEVRKKKTLSFWLQILFLFVAVVVLAEKRFDSCEKIWTTSDDDFQWTAVAKANFVSW